MNLPDVRWLVRRMTRGCLLVVYGPAIQLCQICHTVPIHAIGKQTTALHFRFYFKELVAVSNCRSIK